MKKLLLLTILALPIIISASCPIKPDPTKCQACDLYTNPDTKKLCKQTFCPVATPLVTPTLIPMPNATATPIPIATPSFMTTLNFVNGFSNCNTCTDNQFCHCPNGVACSGSQSCHGDRTFWYLMPGFDLIPQGTGCETAFNPIVCRNRDSQGTPCGGAPACDNDHLGCYRVFVGCNGKENDDPRGSDLTCSGITCVEDADHYGFNGTGTIGQSYSICARPRSNPYLTADGRSIPVQGSGEHCISGVF